MSTPLEMFFIGLPQERHRKDLDRDNGDISASSAAAQGQSTTPSKSSSACLDDGSGFGIADEVQVSNVYVTYPRVCRNVEQFKAWQKSREWLVMSTTGNVKCQICADVKSIRPSVCTQSGERVDSAFVDGTVHSGKDAKSLLKKIDKHRDSISHVNASKIISQQKEENIANAFKSSQSLFEQQNHENIAATEKVFRTAYECAVSHLSFSEHPRLINLQSANGLDCGNVLYSDHSCANIVDHIAKKMTKEIVNHIIETNAKFSVLIDESTGVSNVQTLIVYLRTNDSRNALVYFVGLVPLETATAAAIFDKLINFLASIGLNDDILAKQLIGFCSDGASCMTGRLQGVATLMKKKIPNIQSFHCMAHRLELAVKNAVDDVNEISHFRDFIDSVYKIYSMSPKNEGELEEIAKELSVELLKIHKIFDIRWVFSSYRSMKAVWNDLPALFVHFDCCSRDMSRNGKERSKYLGLCKKMQSWLFLAEVAMLFDALFILMQFSKYLQSDNLDVTSIQLQIDNVRNKLLALKTLNGEKLTDFLSQFETSKEFAGVKVVKICADDDKFTKIKAQFFQALSDNITQRFPSEQFLLNVSVLNEFTWPTDPLERALYGDSQVLEICKLFGLDSSTSLEVLFDFAVFKKTKKMSERLSKLNIDIQTYPLSTAACERGFSQMNLVHTASKNCLKTERISSLLMICINGSPVERWNAKKYVLSWLKEGHHGAKDKPTGIAKSTSVLSNSAKLFM